MTHGENCRTYRSNRQKIALIRLWIASLKVKLCKLLGPMLHLRRRLLMLIHGLCTGILAPFILVLVLAAASLLRVIKALFLLRLNIPGSESTQSGR